MINSWLKRLARRTAARKQPGSRVKARRKYYHQLRLEGLESRLVPATHTGTGATSTLWSVDANGNGGSPAGDPAAALVFPDGATNTSVTNERLVTSGHQSQTSVTSSANPADFGQPITFAAFVPGRDWGPSFEPHPPGVGVPDWVTFLHPSGTVTFYNGNVMLGSAALSRTVDGAQATLSTSTLYPGVHSITAVYSGDSFFDGSTSAVLVQTTSGTPNQVYVNQLYHDLLRREPDPGGFMAWTSLLDHNQATRSQVAAGFVHSQEFLRQEVSDLYHTFLHRDPDPIGWDAWTRFLMQGHTLEQVEAQFAASPEYFQRRVGGNTNDFLATLIMDAYNRAINPSDRALFGDAFSSGRDRERIAEHVFATHEFRQDLVQSDYQRFLDRKADPGGLNAAVAALQNGLSDETLIAVLVGAPEYVARGALTARPG
jgi:hypothetical protein